ncbi:hypothetical protein FPCIR_5218 [Fusarium pseudocircinatum]|uniref:Uncharacterized protein n=1 Tax=Fusarium pseudocircinatum TaxID=56676 RepID=A0A8H5PBF5_9HYPO|nr:hypothetical protein FPCIR_5218 [Fusarium pseudocircinatum]
MSMLLTIANALAEFVYDKDIKFTSLTAPDEAPCFLCLTTIHRDSRLLCVAKDPTKPICLCCQNSSKKCGSIPREILGAAQFYWNHVCRLQTLAANPDALDTKELWRVWSLSSNDPNVGLTIQLQEAAATREGIFLQVIQSAGANFSLEEMQARVAAATPLYARDDSKAIRLRKALRRLPDADKTPHGADDGEREDLPHELKDALIAQMNEARGSGCTAPNCPPIFAGTGPVSRGPSQTAPSRKRKRNDA